MKKKQVLEVLKNIRKGRKERKFEQTVDLIVNLKNFNAQKQSVNLFLSLPYKIKDVRVAGFLNKKNPIINSITKEDFGKYKDKKKLKKLVEEHDFFIASPALMPSVATTFGKYLGPAGKMPSPQLGIVKSEGEDEIKKTLAKFDKILRIKSKEPSLKFSIGKEKMKDDEISENILKAYNEILNSLPRKKENIRNVIIKLTMSKPQKIKI